jgi:hypothetical protein
MRFDNLPTRTIAGGRRPKISTQLRLAAGVCVLTSGLLIASAGGAIAVADTEPTGSTTSQSQSADETSQTASITTSAPAASTPQTRKYPIRTTIQGVLEKLRSLGKPVQKQPSSTTPPTEAVVPEESEIAVAASDDIAPADTDPVAPDSNAVTSESNQNPAVTNFAASDSSKPNGPKSATDVIVPALQAVQPVTNAVATVAGAALSMPGVIMALPTSPDPVGDVITSMQNILISVNNVVVPLAQASGDLYSLLVVAGMDAAAVNPVATDSAVGLSAAAGAGLTPPSAPIPPPVPPVPLGPPGGGGMTRLGDVIAPPTLAGAATAGLNADLSLSGTAPLAVESASPTSALALLENTVRAILAPVSLSALAAFALPGIGGLLIICAAGMRLGYRQAKAALAVRTTGIARFARQGPLGVVRSGSLVSLHPRTPRGNRPQISRVTPLFEQAA